MSTLHNETGLEIAIIGMAGRFPGARDIDQFWENLKNGVESLCYFTDDELIASGVGSGLLGENGYVKTGGGILEDKEYFDASFFGYSALEAELMDPQVRIFHECAWHALENAAYSPYSFDGLIGLYAGASFNFYWEALAWLSGKMEILGDFASALLIDRDYLCTRVSYNLNLKGPSVIVKTACSTSLVAVHMACQGILNGECDMALAGGVTITRLSPIGYHYQEGMILSPDGHCRAFDSDARGTTGGDGVGIVVLKRLEDAFADMDYIHAVIKGTAINNDGTRKAGYTAPSVMGQSEVISEAHQVAEIHPETITYLETHGTGTPVGDPIEIEALKMAFNTDKKGFCKIGSVKTNVGHLDSAAGVASLIKTVLALKHRLIPPSLHFQTPNSTIDFENSPFRVNSQLSEWQRDGHPLRAGISSFAIGGTNAHAVLEEAPQQESTPVKRKWKLLLLSAKTQPALERASKDLAQFLKHHPEINLTDTAYTLQVGRSEFPHRCFVVGSNQDMIIDALNSPEPGKHPTFHLMEENTSAVFMFPGLGSQYVNMGLGLYETEPVFREEMDRCFSILNPLLGYEIKEVLYPYVTPGELNKMEKANSKPDLHCIEIAQLIVFILAYALAKLSMNWGIKPHAMIGYSFGEYIAACLAGVFSLEDALKLVVFRGQLIGRGPGGTMLSVPLTADELIPLIPGELSLAIDNGPSCIVSGPDAKVDDFEKKLKKDKRCLCMKLPNAHALHSNMMEPILKEFESYVRRIQLNKPQMPYISNVTGTWITVPEAVDPGYWTQHLRQTVRFADGINQLKKECNPIFIEIGPGRDLCTLLVRHQDDDFHQPAFNLLRQEQQDIPDDRYLMSRIGYLWLHGIKIDWKQYYPGERRQRIPLPTYSFERHHYWIQGNPFQMVGNTSYAAPLSLQPEKEQNEQKNLFYLPSWRPAVLNLLSCELSTDRETQGRLCWLMFIDESNFTIQVVKRLEKEGIKVLQVKPGIEFRQRDEFTFSINPQNSEDYVLLLGELQLRDLLPVTIVHCWGITGDKYINMELTWEKAEKSQLMGLYSLIHLATALANMKQQEGKSIQVKVVTDNMQKLPGDEGLYPGKATLLAAVKVLPRMYSNIIWGSIDISIPPSDTWQNARIIEQLIWELKSDTSHPAIAYRGQERLEQYFAPVQLTDTGKKSLRVKEKGVYIITDGLTGNGFEIAQYLAVSLKSKLVLIENKNSTGVSYPGADKHLAPPALTGEWLKETRILMDINEEVDFITKTEKRIEKERELKSSEDFEGLEEKLNDLCSSCILDYFKQNALDLHAGSMYTLEALKEKLRLQEKFNKFLEFFLRVLAEDRIITLEESKIMFLKRAGDLKDAVALKKEIETRYPEFKGSLKLLDYCRQNYTRALSGEVEAISILYPGGHSVELMEEYQDDVECSRERLYIHLFKTFISRLLRKKNRDKKLRVLEIGAGKGLLTYVIAPELNDQEVEYYFTDIGNFFVVNARKETGERGFNFMKFGVFDITKNPVEQGFESHCFDLIVGLNVVNATKSIEESLKNLKPLLAPGGILCLIEGTNPKRWLSMVVGLAEGWWYFEDSHLRSHCALLSLDTWQEVFEKQGFENVFTFPQEKEKRTRTNCGIIFGQQESEIYVEPREIKEKNQNLKLLEKTRAEVMVVEVDIASREQMQQVVTHVEEKWGQISGIVHCIKPGEKGNKTSERMLDQTVEILLPTIKSILTLDEIFLNSPLDFFVLCSTFNSLTTPVTSNETMGNCVVDIFINSFSHYRLSREGGCNVAINWSPDVKLDIGKVFESVLAPSSTLANLVISANDPTCWFAGLSVEVSGNVSETGSQNRPLLESSHVKHQRPELSSQYAAPRDITEQVMTEIWQEFLGIAQVGIYDDFLELGADSLVFVTIAARIHKALNVNVPVPIFFEKLNIMGVAQYIKEAKKEIHASMEPLEKKDYYMTSSGQRRLYLLQQMDKQSLGYNIPRAQVLEGQLDKNWIEIIFRRLIERHESLRTSFTMVEGTPVQRIHDTYEFAVEFHDLSGRKTTDDILDTRGVDTIISQFVRPFDLSRFPLFRVGLVKVGKEKNIFMVDMHHIIADGISVGSLFVRDFMYLYSEQELPALRVQYKDYAEWQKCEGMRGALKNQEDFWLKKFEGEVPVLNLTTDFSRPTIQSFEGKTCLFELNRDEANVLRNYAVNEGISLFILLLSTFYILLLKLSGQEDIVVGTPVSGRRHTDLENVVGMFINTLPLRNFPQVGKTFREFLQDVRERSLESFANQDFQFEDLVQNVVLTRDTSRNPLFDVMFILENFEFADLKIPGLDLKLYMYDPGASVFDLTLMIVEWEDVLRCSFQYCTKLFTEDTIKRFETYYKKLLFSFIENSEMKISSIELISKEEKKQLLFDFNNTENVYPKEKTIHQLFEEQEVLTPDNIAIVFGEQLLSYNALNKRSNQLARRLREKGASPDVIIGIMVKRSLEMLVGILAILKSGGAYLPLDPDYPGERKFYILKDSNVKLLLIKKECDNSLGNMNEFIDLDDTSFYRGAGKNPDKKNKSNHLVYVIYTSGSTGKPKGVMIRHYSLINRLHWMQKRYQIEGHDIIMQKTPYTFDVSLWEIFWWSMVGARVCVLIPGGEKEPQVMIDAIQKYGITIMHFVPSMLNVFLEFIKDNGNAKDIASLEQIIASGEALTDIMVELFNETLNKTNATRLANLYGPTEATVDVSYFDCPHGETVVRVPIGKPIDNIKLYILDNHFNVQPIGIAGELCIVGDALSRGYLNRPGLTAEKFIGFIICHSSLNISIHKKIKVDLYNVQDDRCRMTYHRLYRTGDLTRWLQDGNIEFLGRIDHQVKIRGFRIELGEIESQLLKCDEINEAVVVAKTDETGDKHLCAYIVSKKECDVLQLREHLSGKLPDYMIPGYFVLLECIPLSPNGKVDRKALPEPETGLETDMYVPPHNDIEKELVQVWSEVLGIEEEKISTRTNFFAVGGHSLRATVMLAKIHKKWNVELPLTQVFKSPDIKGLSKYIMELIPSRYISLQPTEKKEYYHLSSSQRRLYVLKDIDEQGISYNLPYILALRGDVEKSKFEKIFWSLIKRHESLRTSFHMIADEPVQRILESNEVEFKIEYFTVAEKDNREGLRKPNSLTARNKGKTEKSDYIQNFIRPFDFLKAPLLRVGLIKEEDNQYLLMVDMHHIISDGVSIGLLVREFMSLYAGESLSVLNGQYKDFSEWQNIKEVRESIIRQGEYWLREFEGEIPVLNLSTDFPRPMLQGFEGRIRNFELDKETTRILKEYALEEGTTFFVVLLAAYNVFLHKLSNQEDIAVGTPIAGRSHADLQQIVGMFVNTLVLRNFPRGEKSFNEFLEEMKFHTLKAFENQDYPYEELVEKVVLTRDIGRNPLFDTMFILQNMDIPTIEIPGLTLTPYNYESVISRFDLTLQCFEVEDKLSCTFEYSTNLFESNTIDRFIFYFERIISLIIENPQIKISGMEIMSEEEKMRLLFGFNDTGIDYPEDKTLQQYFEEQVGKTPYNIALAFEGRHLTYKALNQGANRLARILKEKNVRTDTIAGLLVNRSLEMLIGLLGILKTGGAYLPIDPRYPGDRIMYMLADSKPQVLITAGNKTEISEKVKGWEGEKFFFDDGDIEFCSTEISCSNSISISSVNCCINDLAYVIYTSGSTGKPKGVTIEHKNVVNFIHGITSAIKFSTGKAILALTTVSFDIFVLESLLPLVKGLKVVIASEEEQKDPQLLTDKIIRNNVNILQVTPSSLKLLTDSDFGLSSLKNVEVLMVGGESFPQNLFEKLNVEYQGNIYNMYGPTETTVWSSLRNLTGIETIDIGKPIANTGIYIIDRYNKLLPIGVVGELCIGGDGLSRGYLNRPELTTAKFILNPLSQIDSTISNSPLTITPRWYRTGDLARWLHDGNIECLGRIDLQVKLRGFRIELGEIENQLLKFKEINEAVVVVKADETGDKHLCAYIVSGKKFNLSELRDFLSGTMVDYMIPSYFVLIEEIPLTPNGKIDRKMLLSHEFEMGVEGYSSPRNEIEEKLVKIWSEVLRIDQKKISIDANFFTIGGHSLRATVMISRVDKELNIKIPLTEIFRKPTIRKLAQFIKESVKSRYLAIEPVEKKEYYTLFSAQKRMYFIQQMDPLSIAYNIFQLVTIKKELDKKRLEETAKRLVDRHESFRTSFHMINNEPVQIIHADVNFTPEYHEFKPGTNKRGNEIKVEKIVKNFVKPFDLRDVPLLRISLIKIEKTRYILLIDMHHIITDGVSMAILVNDFHSLYEGNELSLLRIQYRDYTGWQNREMEDGILKQQEEYWMEQFSGEIPVLDLPTDYPRPEIQSFEGDVITMEVERTLAKKIMKLLKEKELTLNILLLAVYSVLLAEYSGQDDIVIGTAVSGRHHADLQQLIGMFVNMLPLKIKLHTNITFNQFLEKVKENSLAAYENQDYQFDDLVLKLGLQGNRSRNPIFNVSFVMQNIWDLVENQNIVESSRDDLDVDIPQFEFRNQLFDLILQAVEANDVITIWMQYSTKLFKNSTAKGMANHYLDILEQVVENSRLRMEDISVSHHFLAARPDSIEDEQGDFRF